MLKRLRGEMAGVFFECVACRYVTILGVEERLENKMPCSNKAKFQLRSLLTGKPMGGFKKERNVMFMSWFCDIL